MLTLAHAGPARSPLARLRAAPRPLSAGTPTWIAAAVAAGLLLVLALGAADGRMLLAAAGCTAVALVFAARPVAGIMLVLLARPTLDLWADQPVASVGGVSLNPASLLALVLIAVAGPYVLERLRDLRTAPAIAPFAVFAAIALASVAVAPSLGAALTEWLRLVSVLFLYALAYLTVHDRASLRRLVLVLLASAALPVAVAIEQTLEGGSRVIADFGRATGTFLHPDPFGIFMALVLSFAVPLAISRAVAPRWLLWGGVALGSMALIGSYTRNGWIGFLVGLLVLGAVRDRRVLLGVPLVLVAVAVAVPSTVTRFDDLSQGETAVGPGNSLNARFDLWRTNLPTVAHNPLLGKGFKTIVETGGAPVHSDFVRAAVETGVFGLIAFVWMLAASLTACLRAFRRARAAGDRLLSGVGLGGLCAATAFLVMTSDSNLMTQVAVAGTAWGIIAAAHAAGRIETVREPGA